MRTKIFVSLLCFLSITFAACERRRTAPLSQSSKANSPPPNQETGAAKFDVCGLIKNEEIEAVQGSPITDTKSSGHSNAGLHSAQCFYTAAEYVKSVSLSVTRSDPDSANKRTGKDFWKETFGRYEGEEKAREGDQQKKESLREQKRREGEEKGAPPKKITGVGDEAYWSANRVGGALYVLKKDAFIRISIGGADNEETKIEKTKKLAEKALGRL
jgi:hypothetical protein